MIIPHDEIRAEVVKLYEEGGFPKGCSTGWPSVDKLYTVTMGQWTLITGTPASGKSNWLDAMLVNLAKRSEWKFIIYSPENWPLALHHSTLLEKYIGKPFNPGLTLRMDQEELEAGEEWLRGKFYFAKPEKPDLVSILQEAVTHFQYPAGAVRHFNVGVVVDPWNQLEHFRIQGMSETEWISLELSELIRVCREANIHVWLVAHPAKMFRDRATGKLPVPTPSDVSGSAHFWNKADNCITVWRDQAEDSAEVDIHVQKVRFRHIGRIGLATLRYSRITGQYAEIIKTAPVSNLRKDLDE
jgi:twinkle protein